MILTDVSKMSDAELISAISEYVYNNHAYLGEGESDELRELRSLVSELEHRWVIRPLLPSKGCK